MINQYPVCSLCIRFLPLICWPEKMFRRDIFVARLFPGGSSVPRGIRPRRNPGGE